MHPVKIHTDCLESFRCEWQKSGVDIISLILLKQYIVAPRAEIFQEKFFNNIMNFTPRKFIVNLLLFLFFENYH